MTKPLAPPADRSAALAAARRIAGLKARGYKVTVTSRGWCYPDRHLRVVLVPPGGAEVRGEMRASLAAALDDALSKLAAVVPELIENSS